MSTTKPQPPPGGNVDIGWKLEVGTTVTFLSAAIVVGLRCIARFKYARRGWDDYMMVLALALALVATILDYVAVNNGLGRHMYYLTPEQAINQQYYSTLSQVFCVHALTFAKISIVLSYLRVLQGSQNRVQQWSLVIIAALTFIINTIVIITFYVSCDPPEKTWNPRVPGTCWTMIQKFAFILLQGAFSAFSDFFLALFPFLLLKELKIGKGTKVIVLGLMSLGTVTGIFAVIRTAETGQSLHAPPNVKPDPSFGTITGLMWSGMERNIAILAGSAPALRPLAPPVARLLSRTFHTLRSSAPSEQTYWGSENRFHQMSDEHEMKHYNTAVTKKSRGTAASTTITTASEEMILPIQEPEPHYSVNSTFR